MLMMVDSNMYTGGTFFSGFDTIHDDQIDWYEKVIRENSAEGSVIPSLAFFHIPPKEFKEGWEKCYRGEPGATYHLGFVGEKDQYFGYPKQKEGNFIKRMVALGSLKGFFVGHDHLNTLSIDYLGMRMTYGMSIDYLAYVAALGQIPTCRLPTSRAGRWSESRFAATKRNFGARMRVRCAGGARGNKVNKDQHGGMA